jgi:spermidine synthase
VDRLYAWNTLGAAVGTLASTFLLMPMLGVKWTIGAGCSINLAIFISTVMLSTSPPDAQTAGATPVREMARPESDGSRRVAPILLLGSFFTGAVAIGYEVLWTHVLAFTVGNTVYAFGTMLCVMLCGLGWGARIVSRHFQQPVVWARTLAASQVLLAVVVFLTVRLWDHLSDFFRLGLGKDALISVGGLVLLRASFVTWRNRRGPRDQSRHWLRTYEPLIDPLLFCALVFGSFLLWNDTASFVSGELVRFSCSLFLLIGPALLLGLSFPLLLNLYAREMRQAGSSVGAIYASNTVGAILGSVVTGFVVLPRLGSLATLRSAATLNLMLGAFFASVLLDLKTAKKLAFALACPPLALLLWIVPGHWDARRLSRGSYVYFGAGFPIDQVRLMQEDVQGGLTSVVRMGKRNVLLSNGKFQGDNDAEIPSQVRFALTPILFTPEFRNALVIGLGTGNTLRTVSHFPFQHIEVAELAPSIVEAARLWFEDVNGRVFDRDPRVHVSVADGRNFLLLSRQIFDLITVEVTSIWIAGEADLYNREFYQICRNHLGKDGVLQQWVQIHHMRRQDLLVILNTVAQVFPYVAFFQGPEQGVVVASASPLECDYRRVNAFDADPQVRRDLDSIGVPSMASLLGELMVYGDSMHQVLSYLPTLSGHTSAFTSTDFYPYLEYQTPKANVLSYDTARMNLAFLRLMRPPLLPPDLRVNNLPSANEENLLLGYILEQRHDDLAAVDYFRRVEGISASRAAAEIARIQSRHHTEEH